MKSTNAWDRQLQKKEIAEVMCSFSPVAADSEPRLCNPRSNECKMKTENDTGDRLGMVNDKRKEKAEVMRITFSCRQLTGRTPESPKEGTLHRRTGAAPTQEMQGRGDAGEFQIIINGRLFAARKKRGG